MQLTRFEHETSERNDDRHPLTSFVFDVSFVWLVERGEDASHAFLGRVLVANQTSRRCNCSKRLGMFLK